MKTINLSLLLSGLLLAGCTIPNQSRYQISPARPGGAVVTQADKDTVKEILQTVAEQLKLKDLTSASLVPSTIVYYQEIDSNTPVKLLAWTDGEKIMVELAHWPDTIGETLPYRGQREYIESELARRFGERSSVVAFRNLAASRSPKPH
jgi:hypothetical protein